jgi:hypothetical protein
MSTTSDRVLGTPPTNATKIQSKPAFLTAGRRVPLSGLMRDPFVREAFEQAERDNGDDFGELVEIDHPKHLDGGAAEVIGDTGRHIRGLVEA